MMKHAIYFDYAATTPVDPAVLRVMQPYFSRKFGNAGSLHSFGQEAIAAVDRSRERLARMIGAAFREIIFTGSATEANNLALRGVVKNITSHGSRTTIPRIITSAIEHESVLETAKDLEKDGVEVVYLSVDKSGIVDLKKLKESLTENTILVSVMYVNNEIGSVQPIAEIAKIIREFREVSDNKKSRFPLFHADAAQAFGYFDCNVKTLGVDLATLSSHKIYGPKGSAALYVKHPESGIHHSGEDAKKKLDKRFLDSVLTGGGQEFGLRSGTENVPAIVGFAKAAEMAVAYRAKESERIAGLRDYFWRGIKKMCPKSEINGVPESRSPIAARQSLLFSPHILNVYFAHHDTQDILTRLDLAGVATSSGSACRSRAIASSYVIEALGHSKERATSSVRFSFGRPTTVGELEKALKIMGGILLK